MEPYHLLESQIRECFGRVVYTHKTHSKMADSCSGKLTFFKVIQIILAALTASGVTVIIFSDEMVLKIATAIVSFLSVGINLYMKGFDPGATAQKHRDTASALWPIRESYLSLLTDIRSKTITLEQAREKREELQGQLAAIHTNAPHTTSTSYAAAQTALQQNEEYTFNDKEIDAFLPPDLRRDGL